MSKKYITSIIFGSALILTVLLEEFLSRSLWIFQPIPFLIAGVGCLFILLSALINKNWNATLVVAVSGLLTGAIYLPKSELFKIDPVLTAILIDDLSSLTLILREDNTFELIPETWMGVGNKFNGKYEFDGTRIIFLDKPYDNDFIPDTVDIYQDKIILNGDISEPDTTFANFFNIEFVKENPARN